MKLNDLSMTPPEKSPIKESKLKKDLEPLHDSKKNDAKLETVINQLANLNSPTKEPATQSLNKGPCEVVQNGEKLPSNSSPIPSPRKIRDATMKNENSTDKGTDGKQVFGERYPINYMNMIPQSCKWFIPKYIR